MASSNRRTISVQRDATSEHRYFIITLTNHPNLLQRTQQFQQLINQQQQLFGILYSEQHEKVLYDALQFELQETIQAYLQRTAQSYPINLVFDMSNIEQ